MAYDVTGKAVHDIELDVQGYGYDSFSKVILMKQNDVNSHVIHVKLNDKNNTVDVNKANKIQLITKLPNNAPCTMNGVVSNGDVYIDIASPLLKYTGKCECEIQIVTSGTSIKTSYNCSNLTKNVTLDEEVFKTKCSQGQTYGFLYINEQWMYGGEIVNLEDYGIEVEGTSLDNDEIFIDYFDEAVWSSETFYILVVESVGDFADVCYYTKVDAIQLGAGVNEKEKSLQVYDDNIYDAKNHILTVQAIELAGVNVNDWFVGVNNDQEILGAKTFKKTTRFTKTVDAAATDDTPAIQIGNLNNIHLNIDNNELQTFDGNNNPAWLGLNKSGGDIGFASGTDGGMWLKVGSWLAPMQSDLVSLGTSSRAFKDLYLSGNANISKNTTISGNLTVKGNISQEGSTYETHAQKVYSTNDYIYLREGNTGSLTDGNYSGFEFIKYNGTDNGRLVIDKYGIARVGDVGDEQPLATREEEPNNKSIAFWDEDKLKFVTNAKAYIDSNGKIYSNNSEVVNLDDRQTIEGVKTFTSSVKYAIGGINQYTTPSSIRYDVLSFVYDVNGENIGVEHFAQHTNGSIEHQIDARRKITNEDGTTKTVYSYLLAGVKPDGSVYARTPTPSHTDNSTQIATTAFVQKHLQSMPDDYSYIYNPAINNNPDCTINSLGEDSYVTTNGWSDPILSFDDWYIKGVDDGSAYVSKSDGNIVMTGQMWFINTLDATPYRGKQVTLTVPVVEIVGDNAATIQIIETDVEAAQIYSDSLTVIKTINKYSGYSGNIILTATIPESALFIGIRILTQKGSIFTFKYAKLEEGDYSTKLVSDAKIKNYVTTDSTQVITGTKTFKNPSGMTTIALDNDAGYNRNITFLTKGVEKSIIRIADAGNLVYQSSTHYFRPFDNTANGISIKPGYFIAPEVDNVIELGATNSQFKNGYFKTGLYYNGSMVINLADTQTITGIKTFTKSLILAPTNNYFAININGGASTNKQERSIRFTNDTSIWYIGSSVGDAGDANFAIYSDANLFKIMKDTKKIHTYGVLQLNSSDATENANGNARIIIKSTTGLADAAPSATQVIGQISFTANNDGYYTKLLTFKNTSNTLMTQLLLRTNSGTDGVYSSANDIYKTALSISLAKDGTMKVTTQTPLSTSNDTQISTTAWVRDYVSGITTNYTKISSLAGISSWVGSSNLVTLNTIAYWDGRYATTSNLSNLTYCKYGYIVGTTGTQTISGAKTFSTAPKISATLSNDLNDTTVITSAWVKTYIDSLGLSSGSVTLTTDQTNISGKKYFTNTNSVFAGNLESWQCHYEASSGTAGWYKFLTVTKIGNNCDIALTIRVHDTYGANQGAFGNLNIHARWNTADTVSTCKIYWGERHGINVGAVKGVINGKSVDFYFNITSTLWGSAAFTILSATNRHTQNFLTNASYTKITTNGAPLTSVTEDFISTQASTTIPSLTIYSETTESKEYNCVNPRIDFKSSTSSGQDAALIYTLHNSIADPAGLHLVGSSGVANLWFIAPRIKATTYIEAPSIKATGDLTVDGNFKNIGSYTVTGKDGVNGTILETGTIIKSGSVINGTTYSADTTTTADITITSTSTLAKGSTIKKGSYINGTSYSADTVTTAATTLYKEEMYFKVAECTVSNLYRGAHALMEVVEADNMDNCIVEVNTYRYSASSAPYIRIGVKESSTDSNNNFWYNKFYLVANYNTTSNTTVYQIWYRSPGTYCGCKINFIQETADYRNRGANFWSKVSNNTTASGFRTIPKDTTTYTSQKVVHDNAWHNLYALQAHLCDYSVAYNSTTATSNAPHVFFKDVNRTTLGYMNANIGAGFNALNFGLRNKSNTSLNIEFVHYTSDNTWWFDCTTNATVSLGQDSRRWKHLYLSGNAYFATPATSSRTAVGATTSWVHHRSRKILTAKPVSSDVGAPSGMIPLKLVNSVNITSSELTVNSSGMVVIGSGVNYVLVSANLLWYDHNYSGSRYFDIKKTSGSTTTTYASTEHEGKNDGWRFRNYCLSPVLIPVTSGDIVGITLTEGTTYYGTTYMTVEVVG